MISRRALISATTALPLAACGGSLPSIVSSVDPALGKAIGYIDTISTAISDILPALPPGLVSEAQSVLASITAGANVVKSAPSISASSSTVSKIVDGAASILSKIGVSLPPPYNLIASGIGAVLPGLASIFGIGSPAISARVIAARVMTPDTAAAMLRDVHASLHPA